MTSFIMNSILVFFVLVITIGMAYSRPSDKDFNDLQENKYRNKYRLEKIFQRSELSSSLRDTQGCVDTAFGNTDYYGNGCEYYEDNPNECGEWDTNEFTANSMCCACEETDGDTTDVPTEAPGPEVCFNVTTHTTDWGNENDWIIGCKGECSGCANDPEFGNHATYSQQCCMPQNETEFTITCMDEWGDGWHGGFLEINGTQYCDDFSIGYEYQESMPKEEGTEPEAHCYQCVFEFAENGGCDCMQNEACNVTALIPEECYPCGDAANEYCAFVAEIGYPEYSGGVVIDA